MTLVVRLGLPENSPVKILFFVQILMSQLNQLMVLNIFWILVILLLLPIGFRPLVSLKLFFRF